MIKGELGHNVVRVALINEQWQADRVAPKNFGDNQTVKHTGPGGGPMVMVHLTAMLERMEDNGE